MMHCTVELGSHLGVANGVEGGRSDGHEYGSGDYNLR